MSGIAEVLEGIPFPKALQVLRAEWLGKCLTEEEYWTRAYGWLMGSEVWARAFLKWALPVKPQEEAPPTRHPDESDDEYDQVTKLHQDRQKAILRSWKVRCEAVGTRNRITRERLLRMMAWAFDRDRNDLYELAAERLRTIWRYSSPERAMMEWRRREKWAGPAEVAK